LLQFNPNRSQTDRKTFWLFLAILSILAPGFLSAKTYNLQDIYRLAISNSRELQISELREYQSLEQAKAVKAGLLPQVTFSVEEARMNRFAVTKDSQVIDHRTHKNERVLSVTQALYQPSVYRKYRQYNKQSDLHKLQYELDRQNLCFTVLELYFSLLKEQDSLKILETKLRTLKTYEEITRRKMKNGLATKTDLYKTRIETRKTELSKFDIETNIQSILNQLFQISGDRIGSVFSLAAKEKLNLDLEPEKEWLRRIFEQNIEIRIKEADAEMVGLEVDAIRAEWFPTLEFSFTYTETDLPQSDPEETYALTLEWPIFQGFSSTALRDEKILAGEIIGKEVESLKLSIENKLLNTYFETGKTVERIHLNRQLVEDSGEVLIQVRKQMEKGVKTIVDLIESENEHREIQLDLNRNYYDFLTNKAKLHLYSGNLSYEVIGSFNQLLEKRDD
jgi:outer membrane protein